MDIVEKRLKRVEKLAALTIHLMIDVSGFVDVSETQINSVKNMQSQKYIVSNDLQASIVNIRRFLNAIDEGLQIVKKIVTISKSFLEKNASSPNPIKPNTVFVKRTRLDEKIFAENADFAQQKAISPPADLKQLALPENLDLLQIAINQRKISLEDGQNILFDDKSIWIYEQFYSNGTVLTNIPKNARIMDVKYPKTKEIVSSMDALQKINQYNLSKVRGLDADIAQLFNLTQPIGDIPGETWQAYLKSQKGTQDAIVVRPMGKKYLLLEKSCSTERPECLDANYSINQLVETEVGSFVPEIIFPKLEDETVRNQVKIGEIKLKLNATGSNFVDAVGDVFNAKEDHLKAIAVYKYVRSFGKNPTKEAILGKIGKKIRDINEIY